MAEPELLDRDVLVRLPAESEADWYARVEREVDVSRAGPLALWAERRHPLVRAEMRRRRRQRWLGLGLLVGVPYALVAVLVLTVLVFGPVGGITTSSVTDLVSFAFAVSAPFVFAMSVMLTWLWPLAVILGCAAMATESVADERRRDTAAQLALTPLPPRALAAAKVLPYVWAAVWALAALLPIYVAAAPACGSPGEGVQYIVALTPLRPIIGFGGIQTVLNTPAISSWVSSAATGIVMFIGDLVLAWAAIHWGAAWAVRHGGTVLAGAIALAKLLGVLLGVGLVLWASEGIPLLFRDYELIQPVVSAAVLLVVMIFGGRWLAKRATRAALREFAGFHRLAADRDVGGRWPIGR